MKKTNKDYILMPETSTYALGVEAIRESSIKGSTMQPIYTKRDGSWIVRPLTFAEDLQAMVEDYNTRKNADGSVKTSEERLRFFNKWLDSCTAVAYEKGTSKFKIVPKSLDLIEIPSGFNEISIRINYDGIDGFELDSSNGKYNKLLTKKEFIRHPAWFAAVEGNKALLSESAGIVFKLLKQKNQTEGMGFFALPNTETDELRALFVLNVYNYSYAVGDGNLGISGSFLLVAPSQNFSRGKIGRKK